MKAPTDQREHVATALAVGRMSLGAAMAVAPSLAMRPWLGGLSTEARALTRMLGVRDVALGGWLLGQRSSGDLRGAAAAGAVADGVDALIALALARRRGRSLAVAAVALTGAVAGIWVARGE